MPALSQRLANIRATGTRLRSAARIDLNKHTPGTFSLVRDHIQKSSPASIVDGLRQHPAGEPFDIQSFSRDQAKAINQLSRFFVVEVSPLILNVRMGTLQHQHRLAPSARALPAPRYASLRDSQGRLPGGIITRVVDGRSIAQGCKMREAHVNAYGVRIERQRREVYFASKCRKPASGFSLDRHGLDRPLNHAMQPDSDVADFGDAQLVAVEGLPNLSEGHGAIATERFESRVARILSGLHAAKERLERLIDAGNRIFKYSSIETLNVRTRFADCRQLIDLVEATNRLALKLPSIASFLERGIVKLAAHGQLIVKRLRLALARIDSISERLNHLNYCILTRKRCLHVG